MGFHSTEWLFLLIMGYKLLPIHMSRNVYDIIGIINIVKCLDFVSFFIKECWILFWQTFNTFNHLNFVRMNIKYLLLYDLFSHTPTVWPCWTFYWMLFIFDGVFIHWLFMSWILVIPWDLRILQVIVSW